MSENNKSQRAVARRLAIIAAIGGLLYGYDSAVINGATEAIKTEFATGDAVLGFAVGSALISGGVGALLAGRISDKIGRVPMMKIASVLFFICAVGCGFSTSIWMLVAFRVLGGFAAGVAAMVAPVYIAEISPADERGVLGAMQQLGIVIGIFISLLVNALLVNVSGGAGEVMGPLDTWQWMFMCMAVPSVLYFALALAIPESPRYLVAQHRDEQAAAVLASVSVDPAPIDEQIARMRASIGADHKPSFRDLLGANGRVKPIVWVAVVFMIFNQFTGINVIFYYSNTLWSAVGFTEKDSFTITAITSLVNIVATLIGMTLVDRIGRRPLLLAGSIGMVVAQGGLALLFGTAPIVDGSPSMGPVTGPLALVCANLFVVAFGVTWGTVSWGMLSEMFPNAMRSAGMSVGTAVQYTSNFVVTVSFPVLLGVNVGLVYGLFALFAFLSFFFVLRFVKETKGVALEDMKA
ncbi:sugar porter family MFS transporter [Bifidobacterium eulemuris]|uniref:MFS transporter n=1 Tax=Bifidobacterium eulemuris TaxID=1765219 RepID=A0A261GDL7_9BIFI|nr:sugar porter family MFS transporter [Bifidobacterium eulemuris]OZG69343.1 MFS transporter [Bifidobacterium eulemuris]QOL31164.1 sugar porter family MFS transporter [Bifidobacterium eulemuris]